MNKLLTLILAALLMTSFNALGESLKDAFIGETEKNLKKQYSYLAIAPVEAPEALKMPDSVKSQIEAEVAAILEKEGFKILPAKVMQDIRSHMNQLASRSSAPDAEKQAVVLDHSYRELLFRHDIDGIVALRIQVVGAPFNNDKAEWHGASQGIKHSGDGFAKFITGKKYSGTIAASSLKVAIWDRKEKLLYSWPGGIEVLMHREGDSLNYMPEDQFWQDGKRIQKAVKLALKPF